MDERTGQWLSTGGKSEEWTTLAHVLGAGTYSVYCI